MKAISAVGVIEIPIDRIVIGERRREKLGRLQPLAKSIAAHGLIHPILLRGDTLVAGHRRLEACRSLNWKTIPARQVERLSDDELRAIELDENTMREALSDFATSKARLAQIRQAEADLKAQAAQEQKELLAATAKNSAPPKRERGRPKEQKSRRSVAEATGIPDTTQREIERHVALGERYPFMQRAGWQRTHVLDAGDALDKLPPSERSPLAALLDQPAIPPREVIAYLNNAAAMSSTQRRDIITRAQSDDPFVRRTALTKIAAVPEPPDPGLLALGDAVEDLKRATHTCRSVRFKTKVAALSSGAAKLCAAFRAHEKEVRANGNNG